MNAHPIHSRTAIETLAWLIEHAFEGEINHIRALLQDADRWPYSQ